MRQRMRKWLQGAAAFAAAAVLAAQSLAADIEIRDAWAQTVRSEEASVDVYFELVNNGRMVFLVGVESGHAGMARLCTRGAGCGAIDRLMLAGRDSFSFDRSDMYIRLTDIGAGAGDTVTVRLVFADGTKVSIDAVIADLDA